MSGDSMWIPLDPVFKNVCYKKGVDFKSLNDYINNEDNYLNADSQICGISVPNISQLADGKDSAIVKYLLENGYGGSSVSEIAGGREITSEDLGYLPLSLPYNIVTKIDSFDDIPLNLTESLDFSLKGNSPFDLDFTGDDSINQLLYTPDVYGKRILINYAPATAADQELIDRYNGIFNTPAYLLKLKPQLLIDGKVAAEGSACNAGYTQKYSIKINDPAPSKPSQTVDNTVTAGGMYCVALDYGTISLDEIKRLNDSYDFKANVENMSDPEIYTDEVMGKMLDSISKIYFYQLDMYNQVAAGQNNVTSMRDMSLGIVGFNANVSYTFNRPSELKEGGIFLDIGHDVHSVISNDNTTENEKSYMLQTGMYASAMEHGVLEQVTGIESVSTIKALNYAVENNIAIHRITKDNISDEIDSIKVSDAVKQDIRTSVNSGKIVIIPEETVNINQWSGVGYMVLDPDTYACGYMISGGLAGGAMTWYEVLLAVLINVLKGVAIMLGCMLLLLVFPELAPLMIVLACVSAFIAGFSIGTHLANFIDTGNVREFQEAMIELASFCLLLGIGEGIAKLAGKGEVAKDAETEAGKVDEQAPEPPAEEPPVDEPPVQGKNLYDADGNYTGGRSQSEMDALAKDPDHAGPTRPCDIAKGIHERDVGLALEENGKLSGPLTRDPSGDAEFFDANGQAWDVKSWHSNYPNGYDLDTCLNTIETNGAQGENIIIDTTYLSPEHITELQNGIVEHGLEEFVIWFFGD